MNQGQRTRALTGKSSEIAARSVGAKPRAVEQARAIAKKAPTVAAEANRRLSGAVDLPTGELGHEIPEPLLKPWGAIHRAVQAVDGHLRAAQSEWTKQEKALEEVAKTSRAAAKLLHEMRALMKGQTGDVIRDFSGRVRELAPYAVCSNCSGTGACPGKKCQRIRLAGAERGTCNCKAKLCGTCDGTGLVTGKQKAAAKHEQKRAG